MAGFTFPLKSVLTLFLCVNISFSISGYGKFTKEISKNTQYSQNFKRDVDNKEPFIDKGKTEQSAEHNISPAMRMDRRDIDNEIKSLERIVKEISDYDQIIQHVDDRHIFDDDNDGNTLDTIDALQNTLENLAKRGNRNGALTKAQKDEILKAHNDARRSVIPSAANMMLMKWDRKLEKVAKNYVKKCIPGHNEKRKEQAGWRFKSVGENLHWTSGKYPNPTRAVNSFEKEKQWYNYYTGKCMVNQVCGHYIQVVYAETTLVGCASWRCPKGVTTVCNYSPASNRRNVKPYQKGPRCSKCPLGTHCSNGLCE